MSVPYSHVSGEIFICRKNDKVNVVKLTFLVKYLCLAFGKVRRPQVLSAYDGDLRDPLWLPQERPVPMRVAHVISPGGPRDFTWGPS